MEVSILQKPRIFISYSPEDADFVLWLSEALRQLDHNIWLDREDILGGFQTYDVLHKAMDESEVMLLIMTPHSLKSNKVNGQWTYFYCDCEKKLVPILLEPPAPTQKINFMLASLQHIDFHREDQETALSVLHHTLQSVYSDLRDGKSPDVVPTSYRTLTQWSIEDELSVREAGLTHVHLGMPLGLYSHWLQRAQHTIRLMNTWSGIVTEFEQLFLDATRRGASVQVLKLDPSSPFARQRSLDLHLGESDRLRDAEEVPKNIRAGIRQLADLYPELEDLPGRLELRLYNVLPSFSVHQCDHRALVGFFPHAERTTTFPMLEIEIATPFGEHIIEEFERIWESATPVDLSPHFPAHIEAANELLTEPLSDRELEILRLIADGMANQEIADKLVVTVATVKKHINNLYSKLDVTTRTRAVLRAQELGLV
jgi:DNA-binding CsgD family transcriptional regulator